MGIMQHSIEDDAMDMAEEMAERETGRAFSELPRHLQSQYWDRAFHSAEEKYQGHRIDEAQFRAEGARERKMRL